MKTEQPNENTKRTGRADSRILEWTYEEGPPRRSWRWYILVLLIGLGGAGLLALVAPSDPAWALGMMLWTTIVLAFSLAPSREYLAQLDGQVLYVWDVKRKTAIVERNLNEFATYKVEEAPADRLNPFLRRVILRPRDGKRAIEVPVSADDFEADAALERIVGTVAAAPEIAPSLIERIDRFAQRWFGWR